MMKSRLLGPACAYFICLIPSFSQAAAVSGQGTWETTLLPRDLDGDNTTAEAYYDTVQDITWLADANVAGTTMSWHAATAWAAGLNINGVTGWRLPTTLPIDGTTSDDTLYSNVGTEDRGFNISAPGTLYAGSTASEMAYLYHNTLGNKSYCDPATSMGSTIQTCVIQAGWGLTNTGPFRNIQSYYYWSATPYALDTNPAWGFHFTIGGRQDADGKSGNRWVWAVHSGDVGTPVIQPLEGRLPATPGGNDYQAYYDPNLNITWAANASINGLDTWDNQTAWVSTHTFSEVCGWRLPSADVNGNGVISDCTAGSSDLCSDNEMAYLFHKEGINVSSPGPFNIPFNPSSPAYFWSGTKSDINHAWDFDFNNGFQSIGNLSADDYAWAVHDGDISPAPPNADGDITLDGNVNVADILLGLNVLSGTVALTPEQLEHADAAPLVNCLPAPDGLFTIGDLLVIQRKALGMISY